MHTLDRPGEIKARVLCPLSTIETNLTVAMRIHPINQSDRTLDINHKISQLKPPLHTTPTNHRRNENAINEIMEDVALPQNDDVLLGTKQSNNDIAVNANKVVDDDDDDFMTRIVDGTCRGIFSSAGNNEEEDDRPSLCHLPACQLGDNLNVLMVRSVFLISLSRVQPQNFI